MVVSSGVQMVEDHIQTGYPGDRDEGGQTGESFDVVPEKVVRTTDEQLHGVGSFEQVGNTDLRTKTDLHQKDRMVLETKTPGTLKASGNVVEPTVKKSGDLQQFQFAVLFRHFEAVWVVGATLNVCRGGGGGLHIQNWWS